MGNGYLLLNTVAELVDSIVLLGVLGGAAETGDILLTTVDLAGGLRDTAGDARVEVAGKLLSENGPNSGEDDKGVLHAG